MRRLVFILGSAMTFLMLVADGRPGEDRHWEEIRPLLERVVRRASNGDFQGAWTDYRHAMGVAGTSELLALRGQAFCRGRCPRIWDLARLLGKSRTDLDFLDDICPDMADYRCRSWVESLSDGKEYLGNETVKPPKSQQVEFKLPYADEYDDLRPWIVVEVGGVVTWAMVDTGSWAEVSFGEDWARKVALDYRSKGSSWISQDTDGVHRSRRRPAILGSFRLGTLNLERVKAIVRPPPRPYIIVGMGILLRYDAVCFEWPTEPSELGTLHLGALGPCRRGVAAGDAFLHPVWWHPQIRVGFGHGARFDALVDTGSFTTDCKQKFMAQHRDRPMRFGPHPKLVARCELDTQFPVLPPYPWPVILGTDTLIRFDAFGWELNPFRMYFVPREAHDSLAVPAAAGPESHTGSTRELHMPIRQLMSRPGTVQSSTMGEIQ